VMFLVTTCVAHAAIPGTALFTTRGLPGLSPLMQQKQRIENGDGTCSPLSWVAPVKGSRCAPSHLSSLGQVFPSGPPSPGHLDLLPDATGPLSPRHLQFATFPHDVETDSILLSLHFLYTIPRVNALTVK
jgi:hypothetical protein